MNPNNIQKKSWIQVTRQSGEVVLGIATKVAPWSKNPKYTIVRWKDAAETYSCDADATKCRLATPAEIAAFTDAKLAKYAPVDPSMAQWSLGKIKRGPQMMEGYYFAIPVLFNGVKVGELVDEGNGGCVITRFKDYTLAKTFEDACDKWALENGADGRCNDGKEHFWGWWDEARPKGIDAKTFFKSERESMLKFMAGV
jgi:hypothetical protein